MNTNVFGVTLYSGLALPCGYFSIELTSRMEYVKQRLEAQSSSDMQRLARNIQRAEKAESELFYYSVVSEFSALFLNIQFYLDHKKYMIVKLSFLPLEVKTSHHTNK